jgi:integrase
MSGYESGFAAQLEAFARYRKASGSWSEHPTAENLRYFDRHCASVDPASAELTQKMLDGWCAMRDTENPRTCYNRTLVARQFAEYAHARGLTRAVPDKSPAPKQAAYVPHAFTEEELGRFFAACDSIAPYENRRECLVRKVTCPAFFRLLYSSGIRTIEARLLRREDVDLDHGVLDIRKSKGRDQHYVALHGSMTEVLRAYDAAADRLQPGREWFFESVRGGHYGKAWVSENFRALWGLAGCGAVPARAYDLRHNYAIENIFSWDCSAFEAVEKLRNLSKSMGHRWTVSTLYYYSIVPALADKLRDKEEERFNEVVPEVWDDEEEI